MLHDVSRPAAYTLAPDGRLAALPPAAGQASADGQRRPRPLTASGGALTITPLASGDGLRIDGDIDLATRDQFDRALAALPAASGDVHLHLSGLGFISAAGTRALVALARRLAPGRQLVLHNPPYVLVRILQLTSGSRPAPAPPTMPLPYHWLPAGTHGAQTGATPASTWQHSEPGTRPRTAGSAGHLHNHPVPPVPE